MVRGVREEGAGEYYLSVWPHWMSSPEESSKAFISTFVYVITCIMKLYQLLLRLKKRYI